MSRGKSKSREQFKLTTGRMKRGAATMRKFEVRLTESQKDGLMAFLTGGMLVIGFLLSLINKVFGDMSGTISEMVSVFYTAGFFFGAFITPYLIYTKIKRGSSSGDDLTHKQIEAIKKLGETLLVEEIEKLTIRISRGGK